MKKIAFIVILTVILAAVALGLCSCNNDNVTTLYVYNWGEYISDGSEGSLNVIKEFEKLTGIKVNYAMFDSNEDLYSKLKSGGVSYDVLIPSDYMIARMISENMLQPINFENVPNASYISQ